MDPGTGLIRRRQELVLILVDRQASTHEPLREVRQRPLTTLSVETYAGWTEYGHVVMNTLDLDPREPSFSVLNCLIDCACENDVFLVCFCCSPGLRRLG